MRISETKRQGTRGHTLEQKLSKCLPALTPPNLNHGPILDRRPYSIPTETHKLKKQTKTKQTARVPSPSPLSPPSPAAPLRPSPSPPGTWPPAGEAQILREEQPRVVALPSKFRCRKTNALLFSFVLCRESGKIRHWKPSCQSLQLQSILADRVLCILKLDGSAAIRASNSSAMRLPGPVPPRAPPNLLTHVPPLPQRPPVPPPITPRQPPAAYPTSAASVPHPARPPQGNPR